MLCDKSACKKGVLKETDFIIANKINKIKIVCKGLSLAKGAAPLDKVAN